MFLSTEATSGPAALELFTVMDRLRPVSVLLVLSRLEHPETLPLACGF